MLYLATIMDPAIQLLVTHPRVTFEPEHQEIGKRSSVYNSFQMETTQILIF